MASQQRARAIMKIKKKNTNSVQTRAKSFATSILNNPSQYGTVTATANAVVVQVGVVDKAETLARTKAPGASAARSAQRLLLVGLLETGLSLVQTLADACPTYEQAVSVIQGAGFLLALVPHFNKPILAVKQGPQAGSVTLEANATALGVSRSKKTCFNWAYTLDGKTYIAMPSTPKARTSLANLTPLTTVGFRVSVTGSSGIAGDWSQTVSFFVH
jgi:hypothetical protein